jgi:hypothetical protein
MLYRGSGWIYRFSKAALFVLALGARASSLERCIHANGGLGWIYRWTKAAGFTLGVKRFTLHCM